MDVHVGCGGGGARSYSFVSMTWGEVEDNDWLARTGVMEFRLTADQARELADELIINAAEAESWMKEESA